ncbi:hypothetical protein LTR95_012695 [Oleoguttula sp. CCFEE 5521]
MEENRVVDKIERFRFHRGELLMLVPGNHTAANSHTSIVENGAGDVGEVLNDPPHFKPFQEVLALVQVPDQAFPLTPPDASPASGGSPHRASLSAKSEHGRDGTPHEIPGQLRIHGAADHLAQQRHSLPAKPPPPSLRGKKRSKGDSSGREGQQDGRRGMR